MKRLSGPRICAYRFPGRFQNTLSKLKLLPFVELEKELAQAGPRLNWGGNIIGAQGMMEIVVASNFDAAIIDQAKDYFQAFSYRRPGLLSPQRLAKQLGLAHLETPEYYLGPLYETLPRGLAVDSFRYDYLRNLFDPFFHNSKNMIQAGRILLRFSEPEEAAKFIMELMEKDPRKTRRLLVNMRREHNIREYPYRCYELEDLKKEVNYLLPRPYLL
jgi:hypothetical protein